MDLLITATEAVAPALSNPSQVNFDALALSLAAQNNAIAWGATVLAAIALLVGFIGSIVVVSKAKQEAHKAALDHLDEIGPALMRKWLESNLPRYLRDLKEMKSDDIDGDRKPDFDATTIGDYADEAPQGQPDDHQGSLGPDAGSGGEDRR
ncbi:hypothetical protein [Brevundimonas diminuta]|uniref:Uncharacterized protein n=1 Tax=Brevundimonas diminuta TaxID=293 RepID=A0A410NVF7_BREDI|nr:hypothetical protein [Brevundimonas diminuta]QAT13860.1 hypothetical protein EQG53_05515 [Brevundimonas diminuta]QQB88774.1 hypothetical protein I6H83_16910 [Brevundimonas diminuta]